MSNKVCFDIAEQIPIHYLGIPYIVENSFNGAFLDVTDIFGNELTDLSLIDKIINKYKICNLD